MARLSVQKGNILKKTSWFLIFLVHLLLTTGLCHASTIILTSTSPDHTVTSGSEETLYGTSTSNRIIIESGAKAELFYFPGQNIIQILSSSDLFTVSRSGALVTFESTDGTLLKIPTTASVQTITFSDRAPLTLSIYEGQVLLDDQVITATPTSIDLPMGKKDVNIQLSCVSTTNVYDKYIWMAVPKSVENYYSINNIEYKPVEISNEYTDAFGNKIVKWNTETVKSDKYSIIFDYELNSNEIIIDDSIVQIYTGDNQAITKYLEPSKYVQSDNSTLINAFNNELFKNNNFTTKEKIDHIFSWVMDNIDYGSGEKDAVSVYNNRITDCGGYANLIVAFSRILGVPAKQVCGISGLNPGIWNGTLQDFGTHCWLELYFHEIGWVQCESTMFGNYDSYDLNSAISFGENRIILSKGDVEIGSYLVDWMHLPWAGKSDSENFQAEIYPYEFHMDIIEDKIYGYPGYWVSPFDKGTGAFIQTYQNHSKEYLTGQNQYSIENYKGQKGVYPDDYWEILTTPAHVLGMDFSWDDWGVSIYAVQGGEITGITLEDNSVNGVHFFIVDKTKPDGWYGADYGHIDVYSMFDNGLISQEKLNLILNGEVVDGPLVFQGQLLGSTGDSCCQVGVLHISTAYGGFSNGEKNIDPMTLWTKNERPDFCDCRPIKYGIPGY